jgi:hypothetical protein
LKNKEMQGFKINKQESKNDNWKMGEDLNNGIW